MSQSQKETPRVLVVDDYADCVTLLSNVVTGLGFEVISAKNGQEAIDCLRNHRVDLIVTDTNMPIMSGTELLAWAKSFSPTVPVVIFHSDHDPRLRQWIEQQRPFAILTKPYDLPKLKKIIADAFKKVPSRS